MVEPAQRRFETPFEETLPRVSPDQHWIAYRSGRTFKRLPAGTISLPFWSYNGPWKTANLPLTRSARFLAIIALFLAVTLGPYGASLVKPSAIEP